LTTVGEDGGAPAVPDASPDASADAPLRNDAEEKSQVKAETPKEKRGWRTLGFWRARWEWFAALVLRHKVFSGVLAGGALLRMIAMLGYRPASWFNDSFDYLHVAMAPYPHPIRPDGYSFLLFVLRPFQSFALVTGVQHLMGLAAAVMIYALLRKRFRLPGWGAALATVPLLYDGYQIQLEHLILSDVMFEFLLVSVVTILLWYGKNLTWKMGGVVGLLLALATLTRTVGEPVLLAIVVYYLIQRFNWRVIVATIALCALPIGAYAGWFWAWYDKPGMTTSSGVFLYARVTEFADCNKIKPPVPEISLCKDNRTSHTPLTFSQDAIWDKNSPFHRMPAQRFTDYQNQLAGDFAKRAILAQPLDYARVVAKDFFYTFKWRRTVFPDRATFQMYQFGAKSAALPNWRMSRDKTAASEAEAYEHGNARTRIIDPWATVIRDYQKVARLPGTLLGGILIVGLAGLVPMWRRWGGEAFLPWVTATGLLLVPPATAEFDYRYVLPTVPVACLAAAITFSREPRERLSRAFRRRKDTAEASEEKTGEPATAMDAVTA
jgi:hypothetical protein